MTENEPQRIATLKRAFTRGRFRESLRTSWPFVFVALLGVGLAEMPLHAAPYAVGLVLSGLVFSFLGRAWGRVALPALLLGILPLVCSIAAQSIGHVCTPNGCTSICVPLCSVGGLLAGALLARFAAADGAPLGSWARGSVLVLMTGAMGCSCIGMAGTVAMAASLGASSGLYALRRSIAP